MISRKFPVIVRCKGHVAKIHDKRPKRDCYRVTWQQSGKQFTRDRVAFKDAEKVANDAVKALARGESTNMTSQEVNHMKLAQEVLREFKGVSLLEAVTQFARAKRVLPDVALDIAAQAWRDNHANVKRVPFAQVADEFLAHQSGRGLRDKTVHEERLRVERFRESFQCDVCDLTKSGIEHFFAHELKGKTGKTRNHFRQTLRQILKFAVRRDYLGSNHRLGEVLTNDPVKKNKPGILTPRQFQGLLKGAKKDRPGLVPYLAIAGFAGIRREEILRLKWEDVWRAEGDKENPDGYITIDFDTAKEGEKRHVPILPALAAWLEPYRNHSGPIWTKSGDVQEYQFTQLKKTMGIKGHNLLRHSYPTYRLARTGNSARTARETGHSERVMLNSYFRLVTVQQAKAWFSILPEEPANVISARSAS